MKYEYINKKYKQQYIDYLFGIKEYNIFMTIGKYHSISKNMLDPLFNSISNIFNNDEEEIVMFPEINNIKKNYHLHFLVRSNKGLQSIKYMLSKISQFDIDLSYIENKDKVIYYVTKHFNEEYNIKPSKNIMNSQAQNTSIAADLIKSKKLVNTEEASIILGVSPISVHRLYYRNEIRRITYFRKCYFYSKELYNYVQNNLK